MKRVLGFLMAVVLTLSLVACFGNKDDKKEYKNDGVFTAFEVGVNYGAPQVSWVNVTIKDGKVTKYEIDELQSTITKNVTVVDEEEVTNFVFAWNAKTKKELGDEYGMKDVSEIDKEWDEQARAVEAKWLAEGIDAVTYDAEGYVDNMADASMIVDIYNRLAKAALANAKAGKSIAFEVGVNYGAPQISWVEVKYDDKGKVESYFIDELQSTITKNVTVVDEEEVTNFVFAWNAKTKKELGDEYGMKDVSEIDKEWDEQARAVEAKWLAEGIDAVTYDAEGYVDNMSDASMIVDIYNRLAKAAVAKLK